MRRLEALTVSKRPTCDAQNPWDLLAAEEKARAQGSTTAEGLDAKMLMQLVEVSPLMLWLSVFG